MAEKSLGALQDIVSHGLEPQDFRMFVLQSHYRTESNFSWENLTAAGQRLKRWRSIASLRHQTYDTLADDRTKEETETLMNTARSRLLDSLQDDLNTPEALKCFEAVFTHVEIDGLQAVHRESFASLLGLVDELLGLSIIEDTPDIPDDAKSLLLERSRAREAKDWTLSDELRDKLLKNGISIKDTASGSFWTWSKDAT